MTAWITGGVLTAVAILAAWLDVKTRRIPNALTVGALTFALVMRASYGFPALGGGLLGAGICLALSLPFFMVGGLGGGDVKLLTAFGAFLGPERLLPALVVMAFVGGAMACIAMARQGAVLRTFQNLHLLLRTLSPKTFSGWKSDGGEASITLSTPGAVIVPYGVAISAGALFAWFF